MCSYVNCNLLLNLVIVYVSRKVQDLYEVILEAIYAFQSLSTIHCDTRWGQHLKELYTHKHRQKIIGD